MTRSHEGHVAPLGTVCIGRVMGQPVYKQLKKATSVKETKMSVETAPSKVDLTSPYEWAKMVKKFDAEYPYEGYSVDFIRDIQRNAWMAGVHAAMDSVKETEKKAPPSTRAGTCKAIIAALFTLKMPKELK